MKRAVLAAMVVAAAGIFTFNAPVRASTSHAAVMADNSNPTQLYKFAKGVCGTVSGDGNFTIQVGDEISWKNCTNAPHTVTANDFDSGNVEPGATYAHAFTTAGQVAYHCEIHSYMTGTITVNEAPTPTTQQQTTTTQAATTTTKQTTTTSTTVAGATTTTADINGVFGETPSTEPTTTLFTTETTRALGQGGDNGTSAGVVAALIVGLGAVGTAGALLIRRMRGGAPPS
jgi:plastocyanin